MYCNSMNTKIKTGIALMAIVLGLVLTLPVVSDEAEAAQSTFNMITQGDLTASSGDKPFGVDSIGRYYTHVVGDRTTIYVEFIFPASEGTVYEGWLVDADTGKMTSFGKTPTEEDIIMASLENQFNNDLIVITEEPLLDTDPAPHTKIGGAVLGTPFGQ